MLHILSLGAGVQSSTLALMFAKGEMTPMPNCAVFADTGAEPAAVYSWLLWLEKELPFHVYRVSNGSLTQHELEAEMRKGSKPIMVPYRTRGASGDVGMVRRQCTNHFKLQPINKFLNNYRHDTDRGGKDDVTLYQGISWDELFRMKPAREKWKTHRYPLVDRGMTRGHCLEWMAKNGYQKPPRSACFFCPLKGPNEWAAMDPSDFAAACRFDEAIRKKGGEFGDLYVYRDAIPLADADLRSAEDMGQKSMFNDECEGMCGV